MKTYILFFLISLTMSANASDIDWNADLNYLKTTLPQNHYNLYLEKSESYFLEKLDQISKEQPQLSDFETAIKIQQLIASMGDAHTNLNLKPFLNFQRILPLGLMWFSDGIWIQTTTKSNEAILGSKLTKINDVPIRTVVDSIATLITVDNQAVLKDKIPQLLPSLQFLNYFGFAPADSVTLTIETKGEEQNYTIGMEQMSQNNIVKVIPNPIPLCYQNGRAWFWDRNLENDNSFYVQYNLCWSRENPPVGFKGDVQQLPSFSEFGQSIVDSIQQHDYDKVIFDIRFNGGGNSAQGTELIQKLAAIEKLKAKGKLYVIVGRKTFSSAIINTMDFKNETNAILVGEETGGKPNHLGEIKTLKLPSSGIMIQYSTKYFQRTAEDLNTITPDQIAESSFADFKEGRDPALEWILKQ